MQVASLTLLTKPPVTIKLPYDPNSLLWNYTLNKLTTDTYGGRVVQLLSVNIDTMTLTGDAGSRGNLENLYQALMSLQTRQIDSQTSLLFTLPTKNISLHLWLRNVSKGWDTSTVVYPYEIDFEVEDAGGYGQLQKIAMTTELRSLSAGIGFNSYYAGLSSSAATISLSDVFGTSPLTPLGS